MYPHTAEGYLRTATMKSSTKLASRHTATISSMHLSPMVVRDSAAGADMGRWGLEETQKVRTPGGWFRFTAANVYVLGSSPIMQNFPYAIDEWYADFPYTHL